MPWGIAAAAAGSLVSSALAPSPSGGSSGGNVATSPLGQVAGGALAANQAQTFGNQVIGVADPFQQYQNTFGGMLNNAGASGQFGGVVGKSGQINNNPLSNSASQIASMENNPSSVFQNPVYQAELKQGLGAENQSLAAAGLTNSGAADEALLQYGQGSAANFFNTQIGQLQTNTQLANATNQQDFGQLATLSGLTGQNLGAAAGAASNIYGNVNSALGNVANGVGGLINGLGSGVGSLINGLSGGTNTNYYNGEAGGSTYVAPTDSNPGFQAMPNSY